MLQFPWSHFRADPFGLFCLQCCFAGFFCTGPISLSLAFSVFLATTGRSIDVSSGFMWLGPIPACNIPISGQFCSFADYKKYSLSLKQATVFNTLKYNSYSLTGSLVLMLNTGLGCPHSLSALNLCGTHLSCHNFFSTGEILKAFQTRDHFLCTAC